MLSSYSFELKTTGLRGWSRTICLMIVQNFCLPPRVYWAMAYHFQLVPKDIFLQASACMWSSSSWKVWLCTGLFWRRKSIILRRFYLPNPVNFSFLCEHEVKKRFAKILLIWGNQVKIQWLSKFHQSGAVMSRFKKSLKVPSDQSQFPKNYWSHF